MGYKRETTLNEKDSLTDLLLLEKSLVKLYGSALTEGACKCFRTAVKNNMIEQANDQFTVFNHMQKNGYYETMPADKAVIDEQKANFKEVKEQLH